MRNWSSPPQGSTPELTWKCRTDAISSAAPVLSLSLIHIFCCQCSGTGIWSCIRVFPQKIRKSPYGSQLRGSIRGPIKRSVKRRSFASLYQKNRDVILFGGRVSVFLYWLSVSFIVAFLIFFIYNRNIGCNYQDNRQLQRQTIIMITKAESVEKWAVL